MIKKLTLLLLLGVLGCTQQMAVQPRYQPLQPSRLFPDGQSSHRPVFGTVARGMLQDDPVFFTGLKPEAVHKAPKKEPSLERAKDYDTAFPMPITPEVMHRGQERYAIFCLPCHGPHGQGEGVIVRHGYPQAANILKKELLEAPAGYFFAVITHGKGQMPPYASQVPPQDRWAIVAYLRALQLSQHARLDDLPEPIRQRFQGGQP